MAYVVTAECADMKDRGCIEECPVDAIYEGPIGTYINPIECIDCGACASVCPVKAVFFAPEVPVQWREYVDANAQFFELNGLEAPGGYEKVGPQAIDHPLVATHRSRP